MIGQDEKRLCAYRYTANTKGYELMKKRRTQEYTSLEYSLVIPDVSNENENRKTKNNGEV